MRFLIFCLSLLVGCNAFAKEIAGVTFAETVTAENGVVLKLNGAGIRTKFFMDIYLAELYLEQPGATQEEIIGNPGQKRMVMHVLYKEIPQDKLVEGWNEGFAGNTPEDALGGLKDRIGTFNAMFENVTKDQQIVFDYLPDEGTRVSIAGVAKGVIPGKDFNDALLSIWLGDKPVTKSLKKDLLGL
jgi:hypothetical protein